MMAAIWEVTLPSDWTNSLKARLMVWSEASFGHDSIRRLISASEQGVMAGEVAADMRDGREAGAGTADPECAPNRPAGVRLEDDSAKARTGWAD